MADAGRGKKIKRLQLAMEEEELRSLRIPSSAHRGNLSPSKNSFLPTLQEHTQDRSHKGGGGHRSGRPPLGALLRRNRSPSDKQSASGGGTMPTRFETLLDKHVLGHISADWLEGVKQDFLANGGALNLDQFVCALLRSLEPGAAGGSSSSSADPAVAAAPTAGPGACGGGGGGASGGGSGGYPPPMPGVGKAASPEERKASSGRAAAVVDLFRRVDVHGEGIITWDEVSNYLIDHGVAGGDQFTVDSIKPYRASSVYDAVKHDSAVEKLVYLEQMDVVACLNHNSRRFRLYDPITCKVRAEVHGHRGSVVNCCYVNGLNQIATTGADMTICLWDAAMLGLRNRMTAKDVQLCLCDSASSDGFFSGSIDGTLSYWDLRNMCLSETRRGQHKDAINDLLMVEDINLLASGSSDGSTIMWDLETLRPKKTFKGHQKGTFKGHRKGTFSLSYSLDYRCLFTAGLEQEALVWNPYVEKVPIFRLRGHTNALCGVAVVSGTPQVITADVKGVFRLWDMRNFRCVQSWGEGGRVSCLNTFCAMPCHRRLAAGGACVTLFDYMDEWDGETVTEVGGVTDALYNPSAGEFYTMSKSNVKAWSAGTGVLFKVLQDVTKKEITACCLAENGRKLYLGDACGRVAAHSANNGTLLTEFEPHSKDVSCLAVWPGTNKLVSAAWDGTVKVHADEKARMPYVKAEFTHHRDGVTCLAVSSELMLMATGGTDTQVCLYDLKTLKLDHALTRLQHVVSGLDFMSSRCILAVADQGGYVSLWRVRPHPDKWMRVHYFTNWPLLRVGGSDMRLDEDGAAAIPLHALRFAPAPVPEEVDLPVSTSPLLYTGDAKGNLRCWDISLLCERKGVVDMDLRELFERQHFAQLSTAPGSSSRAPTVATAAPTGGAAGSGAVGSVAAPTAAPEQAAAAAPPSAAAATAPATNAAQATVAAAPAGGGGAEGITSSFLTVVDVGSSEVRNGGREVRERGRPFASTVRSAFLGDESKAPPAAATEERKEVQLVLDVEGHDDAIFRLHLTRKPVSLISAGQDNRVRAWNLCLQPLGLLLQKRDPAYKFPYDPLAAQRAKLQEASELLGQVRPWSPQLKLPKLPKSAAPPSGSQSARGPNDTLGGLKAGGRGWNRTPSDPDEKWKLMASRVIADPNAEALDYEILFEQMSQAGLAPETDTAGAATERLLRKAHSRLAGQMTQRTRALSADEASAADRLARAMAAVGGDDFGAYETMARSIRPRSRSKTPSRGSGGKAPHSAR